MGVQVPPFALRLIHASPAGIRCVGAGIDVRGAAATVRVRRVGPRAAQALDVALPLRRGAASREPDGREQAERRGGSLADHRRSLLATRPVVVLAVPSRKPSAQRRPAGSAAKAIINIAPRL